MRKQKILIVFGTRPEAIKMAPLVLEFLENEKLFETKVCVTGQHRQMLDQVLKVFGIIPDFDLDIMKKDQDLFDVSSGVLLGMRDVYNKYQPDIVVVHGDTTTSSMTALSAFYQNIKVAHVEAGLRTYDKLSPWPEEVNRQLTARIATYHFAPTVLSKQNLLNEKIENDSILITGNTVIDALQYVVSLINTDRKVKDSIRESINRYFEKSFNFEETKYVLITGHRRENFGSGFINICQSISVLSQKYPEVHFVYPVHLNPNVRKPVNEILNGLPNVHLIEPLDYLDFVFLMSYSFLILTDSGGIQEEAPGIGKPVLVMRDTTERPEAIESGTVKLVGTNTNKIISSVSLLLEDNDVYEAMAMANNPYGDGNASLRIVDFFSNNN